MIVAQVTATKLKTHKELRYTTAAGAVIQLMGSDEQFSLVEFPIVLAYNRIHHYLPTAYLSDRSLANWKLAQMYKHFTAANEYFVESKASMEYEPELVQALDTIFLGVTEVQRQIRDRAKLGSTAATSVPISLTGKKPCSFPSGKKSLNVIFVTGTSPLRPTEKCTLEGITKTRMMKPNISVNSVGKHLTWNLS